MRMKSYERVLTLGLGLTLAAVRPNAAQTTPPASAQTPQFEEQVSPGAITLRVRPVLEDTVLVFEVGVDTHSGDLASLDLATAMRLRIGDREAVPTHATKLDGHHGTARVTFRMTEVPERFVLLIAGVGDDPARELEWPRRTSAGSF